MLGELKCLTLEHLETVRNWRNHEAVNRFMFHQHFISEQEHQDWFVASDKNPLRHLLIYFENQRPVGFLQLQRLQDKAGVFEWGFYKSPEAARGSGSRMAAVTLSYAFERLNATKVYAEVMAFNLPSIQLHKKLNFREEGMLRKQAYLCQAYQDVHCFGLLKEEWLEK